MYKHRNIQIYPRSRNKYSLRQISRISLIYLYIRTFTNYAIMFFYNLLSNFALKYILTLYYPFTACFATINSQKHVIYPTCCLSWFLLHSKSLQRFILSVKTLYVSYRTQEYINQQSFTNLQKTSKCI